MILYNNCENGNLMNNNKFGEIREGKRSSYLSGCKGEDCDFMSSRRPVSSRYLEWSDYQIGENPNVGMVLIFWNLIWKVD